MTGEVDVQLSLYGLLLLTQPVHSSEQHTRADLEFSSDFDCIVKADCSALYILTCGAPWCSGDDLGLILFTAPYWEGNSEIPPK